MSDFVDSPRKRSRWPLFAMPALVIVLGIGWSAFWFYASAQVGAQFDRWRAREAQSGRSYECGKLSVGGYPFRFEVKCDSASINLLSQTAGTTLGRADIAGILAVAQIYNPRLLIAEFASPMTIAEPSAPSFRLAWSRAQSSVYGLPEFPQRGSLVVDDLAIDHAGPAPTPYGRAKKLELHGRIAEGSADSNPVIEIASQLAQASAETVHPIAAEPFDMTAQARLRGLKDFRPKPWPERFRDIQAAGGRIEILHARVQQTNMIAVASGSLGITAQGMLDGELSMIVAGLDKIVPVLGLDKILEQNVPQATLDRLAPGLKTQDVDKVMGALDRLVPGLGNVVRQKAPAALTAGLSALGDKTTLEGRPAQAFPLRFADGAVYLGPLRVAQTPPLF